MGERGRGREGAGESEWETAAVIWPPVIGYIVPMNWYVINIDWLRAAEPLASMRGRVKGGTRGSRFPAARQECSGTLAGPGGKSGICVRERERVDVSRESEEGWTVIHALSYIPRMRASRVMRFVRHWFSVGASLIVEIEWTISLLCFTLKGLNAIAVIRGDTSRHFQCDSIFLRDDIPPSWWQRRARKCVLTCVAKSY